jgi:hypothetical protein
MAEDRCALDPDPRERRPDQVGLCLGRPKSAPGAAAVTIAGAVERDYAVLLGSNVDQTARLEILDHAAVAVQQDERLAAAALYIVQSDAIDVHEPAGRRIIALGLSGQQMIHDGRNRQRGDRDTNDVAGRRTC